MEPVAPRTVTLRMGADAAVLVLRNGTALIVSPNHKCAADAIQAAAENAEYCSHHDRGNQPVEAVHQPTMARYEMAGILHPETTFYRGFKEIAELAGDGQCAA